MGCAYPLMFAHVQVFGDPPFKKEPLPYHYQGEPFWQYFHQEESWWDDSNRFEDPFEDVDEEDEFMKPLKRSNSYEILEVDRDADENEIKRAFRKKCLKTHPDKVGGDGEMFRKVKEAYDTLICMFH